jgi:hypothetical protein
MNTHTFRRGGTETHLGGKTPLAEVPIRQKGTNISGSPGYRGGYHNRPREDHGHPRTDIPHKHEGAVPV